MQHHELKQLLPKVYLKQIFYVMPPNSHNTRFIFKREYDTGRLPQQLSIWYF